MNESKNIIKNLSEMMEMQINRENNFLHIPAKTATFMWNESMNKARVFIGESTKTLKEDFEL